MGPWTADGVRVRWLEGRVESEWGLLRRLCKGKYDVHTHGLTKLSDRTRPLVKTLELGGTCAFFAPPHTTLSQASADSVLYGAHPGTYPVLLMTCRRCRRVVLSSYLQQHLGTRGARMGCCVYLLTGEQRTALSFRRRTRGRSRTCCRRGR